YLRFSMSFFDQNHMPFCASYHTLLDFRLNAKEIFLNRPCLRNLQVNRDCQKAFPGHTSMEWKLLLFPYQLHRSERRLLFALWKGKEIRKYHWQGYNYKVL